MKTTEHIERLMKKGWKRKRLIEELGFPREEVLKVYRRLKKIEVSENAALKRRQEAAGIGEVVESPPPGGMTDRKLAAVEAGIRGLTGRVEGLERDCNVVRSLQESIAGTPEIGLKRRYSCQCGASGFVAIKVKCTKCDKENWIGWWPEQK